MFIVSVLTAMCISTLWAGTRISVVVVPFSINSSETIDYVRDGIWDMLISRLSAGDTIEVISKQAISDAVKALGKSEIKEDNAYSLAKRLHSDYVVWGTVTKIGKGLSIDGKVLDIRNRTSHEGLFQQCETIDAVIPKVNDFASKVESIILGSTAQGKPAEEGGVEGTRQVAASSAEENPADLSAFNPGIVSASKTTDSIGFWLSDKIAKRFKGLDIGDVDADGRNEIVVIDDRTVMIYRREGDALVLLHTIQGRMYDNYIAVDTADVNRNGIREIFVTNVNGSQVESFVLEYRDGGFEKTATELKWFLRVIGTPVEPMLLAQSRGIDAAFGDGIYSISWKDGRYVEDKRIPVPAGLSIYGLTIDAIDASGIERCIALGEYDHLCIYAKTGKALSQIHILGGGDELLWKSDEVYGGSNNVFNYGGNRPAGYSADTPDNVYIELRVLTVDMNRDGKREVLIAKNLSSVGNILKNLKVYSGSELYHLEWDGIGMRENWKTRKIQGYIADYQFKDIDNDGRNEIVLVLGLSGASSVIAAYDM